MSRLLISRFEVLWLHRQTIWGMNRQRHSWPAGLTCISAALATRQMKPVLHFEDASDADVPEVFDTTVEYLCV
jgi:hypothetical protein